MAIELCGVSKRFGDTRAVDGVSLTLAENTIYGLLGNNGAGKSTLLNLITGRLLPDSGTITLDGTPVAEHDGALGQLFLVGENNLFPAEMRVKRAFGVTARFYPTFNIMYALSLAEKFGLDVKKKITALSTGYGSIFRLILALSVNTPYVFLDEPVLGLDAQHRDLFYQLLLEKYLEHPCTIVISTHLIQEVAALIAHTVILRDGKILRDCPFSSAPPAGAPHPPCCRR
ncbi:MAG: ABC transporter ATP-binding protein [Oscillospiraceae bacterium]